MSEPGAPRGGAGQVRGIVAACLTPFGEDARVDYGALEREIEFILPDADAITVGAVEAAEYTMLTVAERAELLRQATRMVAGRLPVILGASAPAVREVLALAEHAAEVGGDLVQVLMPLRPWGGQPSADELLDYFGEVAAGSPLPLVAYHNHACGCDPPVEAWVQLSRLPQVQYFKESSRDVSKIGRLVEDIDLAGHARYFTTMQPLLTTLLMGGSGATMPPPGTRIGAEVVRAFRDGDLERARLWQRVFGLFPARWSAYGLPPVMKAAMRHFGVDIGGPARPYRPVSAADDAAIGRFLAGTGLLDGRAPSADALREAAARLGGDDAVGARDQRSRA